MGVKSTVTLTRHAAELRFLELFVQMREARRERKVRLDLEHLRTKGTLDRVPGLSHLPVTDETIRDVCVAVDALKRRPRLELKARQRLANLNDSALETVLETLNDQVNDGEGFDNFTIEG